MHSDRRDLHTRILTSPPLRLVISTRNLNRSTCLPRNVQFRRSLPLRNSFYRVFVLPPDICSRAIAFHGRNPGAALARLSHFQVAFIRLTIPSSCFFPWQFKSSLDIQSTCSYASVGGVFSRAAWDLHRASPSRLRSASVAESVSGFCCQVRCRTKLIKRSQ